MIQREVAERIACPPGSKEYGILSVLLQAWYDIEYLFTVGEKVFNPPPKVKSAVIRLRRNGVVRLACDERLWSRLRSVSGARCCAIRYAPPSAISAGRSIPFSRSAPNSCRWPISWRSRSGWSSGSGADSPPPSAGRIKNAFETRFEGVFP